MSTTESKEDVNYDYNFGNFNPDDVEVEDTINAVSPQYLFCVFNRKNSIFSMILDQ